jgi:hypothetical protein
VDVITADRLTHAGRVRAPAVQAEPSPLPPPRRARPSPSRCAAVSAPVSHRLPVISMRRCRAVAHRQAAPPRVASPCAPPGRGRARPARRMRAARVATGRGRGPRQCCARGLCPAWPWAAPRTVRLGRDRFQPSCTRLNFINL